MPAVLLPVVDADRVKVYLGDTVVVLPLLPASSVDSVVTDPPYGLGFADQEWDGAKGFRESLTDVDTSGMSDGEVFQTWCAAWAASSTSRRPSTCASGFPFPRPPNAARESRAGCP